MTFYWTDWLNSQIVSLLSYFSYKLFGVNPGILVQEKECTN